METSWKELIHNYEGEKKNEKPCISSRRELIKPKDSITSLGMGYVPELSVKELNKRRAKQLERTCGIDVVSNNPLEPLNNLKEKLSKEEKILRPYNIISNLSLKKHHFLSPDERPQIETPKEPKAHGRNNTQNERSISNKPRDYDIVTNTYFEANEAKVNLDSLKRNLTIAAKLQLNHKNPLTGEGCSELPHSSKRIFHDKQQENINTGNRREKGGKTRQESEKEISSNSQLKQDIKDKRAIQRCSILRHEVEGKASVPYNIISGKLN